MPGANGVGRAVMEASGGYERDWARALRAAGFGVRIVDPKRVRHFAKAAGKLAKNDPIDAETIARFAESFNDVEPQPHDAAQLELDQLVQARTALKQEEDGSITRASTSRRRSSPRRSPPSPRPCAPSCASSTPPSPPRSRRTPCSRGGARSSSA